MEVERIEFGILDRRDVLALSAVKITNPIHNVEFKLNNSLHDTRLGAFKNVACGSCTEKKDCPGHFGHIQLHLPVLNPLFVTSNLKSIIDSFCFECYKQISKCACIEDDSSSKKRRRSSPTLISMNQREKFSRTNSGVKLSFTKAGEELFLEDLYLEIKKIAKEDYLDWKPSLKNFTDLTDICFIHNLLVLPTASRPPNFNNGQWCSQHITRLYIDVMRKNDQVRMKRGLVISTIMQELHQELQSAIDILFDTTNTKKKLQQNVIQNGGIRQRIDGKKGRIRMNLMGKRTEFSARSVLSGDPSLGMNEVGIPPSVAETLTVPMLVNRYNIDAILLGKFKLRYIFKANGDKYDLSVVRINPKIEIGDTVERCLIDGDIVAVNRQPTLWRGSIIACYVKIIQTNTFRLNYSSMVTLNGDCDGDEVNIHVPQDHQSRAELEELMLSSTNIVCSQDSKPVVGLIQDSLLGSYQISRNDRISRNDMMDILFKTGIDDVILTKEWYHGRESMDFVLESMQIDLDRVEIPKADFLLIDSKVQRGVFSKAVLGAADNSVIHHIYLSYGHIIAAKFIHKMQKVATAYLDIDGFSVGIADCVVTTHEPIHHRELDTYIQDRKQNHGEDPDEEDLLEATGMVTKLEAPPDITPDNNALWAMISSGAKGSAMNFNQITRMLGQQVVGAGRVPQEFANGTRTLPHFHRNDPGLPARGFVSNSFIKGLSPTEFFQHAQGGRIGLIDTACKTADTGAQYRRLVKNLEKVVVVNGPDGTRMVKNMVNGNVVQFDYGEDGLDGTYLKRLV